MASKWSKTPRIQTSNCNYLEWVLDWDKTSGKTAQAKGKEQSVNYVSEWYFSQSQTSHSNR